MRLLAILALIALPSIALAQGAPPAPPIPLPSDLVSRLYTFLNSGGTYTEAAGLRDALAQAVQAPQKEAEVQARIKAAIDAAKQGKPAE